MASAPRALLYECRPVPYRPSREVQRVRVPVGTPTPTGAGPYRSPAFLISIEPHVVDGELPTTDHPSMTGMHEWRMGRMSDSPARYERGGSLSSHRSTGASSPHTQSLALL